MPFTPTQELADAVHELRTYRAVFDPDPAGSSTARYLATMRDEYNDQAIAEVHNWPVTTEYRVACAKRDAYTDALRVLDIAADSLWSDR